MKKYIVRADRAGVFYGEIESRNGSEIKMKNVRKIWSWDGAAAIEQLATEGTKKPNNCKITVEVEEMEILGVIQIILCTDIAINIIDGIKSWKL